MRAMWSSRGVVLVWLLALSLCRSEDRLKRFYHRIQRSDTTYCEDRTKLLPSCTECIPGLQKGSNSSSCDEYIPSSASIRAIIKRITLKRFGEENQVADRPFGLYPYLEKADFLSRQVIFGKMLSGPKAASSRTVMDIGAYYNPINLFFSHDACHENVIIIEPILDALSVSVPCHNDANRRTHFMFLPITFKHYMTISATLPMPDSVVCVGCDSHFGANRTMLETAFERPYTLYLEYPPDYVTDAPFLTMNGSGPGQELTYLRKFESKTNETEYTKRCMKVIHYSKV